MCPASENQVFFQGVSPARVAAVHQLNRIEQGGAYIGFVSSGEIQDEMGPRDERQATEYVAGVTRWRRWLDFVASRFYRGDYEGIELKLRQVLRLGLYDLLFLRTPPHAAVNEAVELAKKTVRPKAGGLVNGILRNVLRNQDNLPQPDTGDAAEDLAIKGSHPTWMVRKWLARFGLEGTKELLLWNNSRPYFALRVNINKITREQLQERLRDLEVTWEPSPYLEDFVRTHSLQPVLEAGLVEHGFCAVQDESAALVVRVLDPEPGDTILDGCAAPGGKTLYAAQIMGNRGRIIAVDVHQHRLRLIERAAKSQSVTIVEYKAGDLRKLVEEENGFEPVEKVLLDAPCSGSGVLAKRADLRWNRNPEELMELTELQDGLLEASSKKVRNGGLLVYSTCSIEPEENEQRVDSFLERHPDFFIESVENLVPASMVNDRGFFESLPHRHGIDGAFAARLRRISG